MKPPAPTSPCNRRCTLHPDTDVCLGCFRKLEEITGWSNYSPEQKLAILAKLANRKSDYWRQVEAARPQPPGVNE